ncbi:hypothetical protein SFUMM280S_10522 [Streptomyces fumanus]
MMVSSCRRVRALTRAVCVREAPAVKKAMAAREASSMAHRASSNSMPTLALKIICA